MLDNRMRRELLTKARQSGFPGSILDVYSAYEQGRDLIAEYQQDQKVKQAQQMSDFAASQTMSQPQPQQPQQQQIPSSPPNVQANVPIQMPEQQQPLVNSSRATNVGLVSDQTGSYKGEAIFAKGGFKTTKYIAKSEGPGCPDGYFKDNTGNCVEILPKSNFRGKKYFDILSSEEQQQRCLDFPGAEGCYKNRAEALENKSLPGYIRRNVAETLSNVRSSKDKYGLSDIYSGLKSLKTLEQKPLTIEEFDDLTNGYGTEILKTGEHPEILSFLDQESINRTIKKQYEPYSKKKLEQITDPVTGKLRPTNDPRAQIDLRETMWERQPTKENKTTGTIDERRQELGYPINMGVNDLFFNRNEGVGELPMKAVKTGVAGLIEDKWIIDKNGIAKLNPNYKGNLTEEGKAWIEKASSKYGIDPAVIGYFNQSTMSDSKKTLADYDPTLLVESERYSKQPILSVDMENKNAPVLSWAQREPYLPKYAPDMEGVKPVTGAIKTGFLPKKKKKKKGGAKCYTCNQSKLQVQYNNAKYKK
jgi:hypothetical protein